MLNKEEIERLEKMLAEGKVDAVLKATTLLLHEHEEDDRIYYIRGKAFMRKSCWADATNCFLQAESINPDSPAGESRKMIADIMNFYNKDLYNP